MRYVMMHKADANSEAGVMPPQELIQGMGRLIGDMIKQGVLLNGDGLLPSTRRVRLSFKGGKATVTKGPFEDKTPTPAAFLAIKVKDMDAALTWARRYGEIFGDGEFEIGPMTETWDLGGPKPEGEVPVRCLLLHKASRTSEAGTEPSPKVQAAVAKLLSEMKQQGVLLYQASLLPSSQATRVNYRGGKRTVTDGPFTESKELIGGFVLLQARSRDEVLEWASRFAKVYGDVEMDLRPVAEAHAEAGGLAFDAAT